MSERDVSNIHKILILRFSSLGDIVMLTAMIRCLRARFPHAQIDMVVREDFRDLILHNPHLDQKIGLNKRGGLRGLWGLWDMGRRLNRERYDLIYDAHFSLRTLLLRPFLQARHKVAFNKHYIRRSLALTFKLPLLRQEKRFLERFIEPLNRFGVFYDGKGPDVHVPSDLLESLRTQYGFIKDRTIGVIPSAQWPGKRWTHFRPVVERLVARGFRVVVFGGKEDLFCQELSEGYSPDAVLNLQGRVSILEAAAALKHTKLVVANDTGLMHVADGVGIPCVLIFGPTSGALGCLPFHRESQIVERDLWCRPCSKNGQAPCIRGRRVCLEGIDWQDVWRSTERLLLISTLVGRHARSERIEHGEADEQKARRGIRRYLEDFL